MRYLLPLGLVAVFAGCGKPEPLRVHGQPVSHWVEALHDPDARVRKRAVAELGNVGAADSAVVPALIGAVKDRDAAVRSEAVLALLKIGPDAREAMPALTAAQRDKDPRVRSFAGKALDRIQGTR